jgi:hypothetical protein
MFEIAQGRLNFSGVTPFRRQYADWASSLLPAAARCTTAELLTLDFELMAHENAQRHRQLSCHGKRIHIQTPKF